MFGAICFVVAAVLFVLLSADIIDGPKNDDIFELASGLVATGLALWDRLDGRFFGPRR